MITMIPKEKEITKLINTHSKKDLAKMYLLLSNKLGGDKDTPRKPILSCDDWVCPNDECDCFVYLEEYDNAYMKPNYCSQCGQALKWDVGE